MSLLDKIHDKLNPAIWGPDEKILPPVKSEIISKLFTLIPQTLVKQVWLIGGSAGLQYNKYSDIDISVVLTLPPDNEIRKDVYSWHVVFKEHNNKNDFLSGTNHPINYFAMPNTPIDWGEETTSIYLIKDFNTKKEDVWERQYRKKDEIRNPQDQYWSEMIYGNLLKQVIDFKIKELVKDVKDLKSINKNRYSSKLREIDRDIDQLVYEGEKLDKDRKTAYSFGFGVPKYGEKNFIYKYIERAGLLNILDRLENL